jgi:hypothetical protein
MDLGDYGDEGKRAEIVALLIAFKRHPELLNQGICEKMLDLYNEFKDELGDDIDSMKD